MKVIIAGTRTINKPIVILRAVEGAWAKCGIEITELVSGGCRGVDKMAEDWARGKGITPKVFEADWNRLGKAAGPIRNQEMVDYADALIAIWDGQSKGTKDVIARAHAKGIPVYIHVPVAYI